jgi:hypothetical protein
LPKDVLLCTSPSIREPDVEEKMKEVRVSKEKAEKENRKLKKQLQAWPPIPNRLS